MKGLYQKSKTEHKNNKNIGFDCPIEKNKNPFITPPADTERIKKDICYFYTVLDNLSGINITYEETQQNIDFSNNNLNELKEE